jgi:hypothetical protein
VKKDLTAVVIAVAVILAATYALARKHPQYPAPRSHPFRLDAPSGPHKKNAPTGPGAQVVMRINGEPVTEAEFAMFMNAAPPQMREMLAGPDGKRIMADQIIKLKMLEDQAVRLGMDKDPTLDAHLEAERSKALATAALQKLSTPDEARLRAEYDKMKDNLEVVEMSHILIGFTGGQMPMRDGKQRTREEAMVKAKEIESRLRAGADFAGQARVQSDDATTAARGGILGELSRASLPPDFPPQVAQALFALKQGEISAPIASPYGIHIFKAGRRTVQTYDQVKPTIAQQLQQQMAGEALKKLTDSVTVEYEPSFFGPSMPPPGAAPTNEQPPKNPS